MCISWQGCDCGGNRFSQILRDSFHCRIYPCYQYGFIRLRNDRWVGTVLKGKREGAERRGPLLRRAIPINIGRRQQPADGFHALFALTQTSGGLSAHPMNSCFIDRPIRKSARQKDFRLRRRETGVAVRCSAFDSYGSTSSGTQALGQVPLQRPADEMHGMTNGTTRAGTFDACDMPAPQQGAAWPDPGVFALRACGHVLPVKTAWPNRPRHPPCRMALHDAGLPSDDEKT